MLHPKDREMPFWRDGRRVALPAGRLMGRTVRMMHTYPESLPGRRTNAQQKTSSAERDCMRSLIVAELGGTCMRPRRPGKRLFSEPAILVPLPFGRLGPPPRIRSLSNPVPALRG